MITKQQKVKHQILLTVLCAVFDADPSDVDGMLEELHLHGFVICEADSLSYISGFKSTDLEEAKQRENRILAIEAEQAKQEVLREDAEHEAKQQAWEEQQDIQAKNEEE